MASVSDQSGQGERDAGHRAEVITAALRTAGGSGAAIVGILTASAFGAITTPLAMLALGVFGAIMLAGLAVAAVYVIAMRS